MAEWFLGWDRWLFEAVNHGHRNALFDILMPVLSAKRYFLIPGMLIGALLIVRGGARERWAVAAALLALAMADLGAGWAKGLAARLRPCHALPGVFLLTGCTGSFSFPSSHATNNFALAAALSYHYPRWAWAFGGMAAAVAYSRVYLGVHYPGDALAGAALGVAVGALAVAAMEVARGALGRAGQASGTASPEG